MKILLIVVILLVTATLACQTERPVSSSDQAKPKTVFVFTPIKLEQKRYPQLFKRYVTDVYQARSRRKAIARAKKGIETADSCLASRNTELTLPCTYYHIVLTGLYYQYRVIGYQTGLQTMVKEAETVIALDPSYEEGGIYRILGNIYLQAPGFSLKQGGITKNIDKAFTYAERALTMAPRNPENLQLMGKVLWEKRRKKEAVLYFKQSLESLPRPGYYTKREKSLIEEAKKFMNSEP